MPGIVSPRRISGCCFDLGFGLGLSDFGSALFLAKNGHVSSSSCTNAFIHLFAGALIVDVSRVQTFITFLG